LVLTSNRGEHRTHNPKVEGSNPSPATNSSATYHKILGNRVRMAVELLMGTVLEAISVQILLDGITS